MRHRARVRRHRVAVRPKVRSQRIRQAAAVGAIGCLAALAALTVFALRRDGAALAALGGRALPSVRVVEVAGVADPLRGEIEAYLRDNLKTATSAELLSRFPALKSARLSRSYWRRTLGCEAGLRGAVGVVEEAGKPAGYLDEDGVVFAAPAGMIALSGPRVVLGASSENERKAVAAFLPRVLKPGALDSSLQAMRYVSPQDGWQAVFEDGTIALWGDLRFTRQKLERLREILADAREQFGGAAPSGEGRGTAETSSLFRGALAADMRYFEDGRVLIRPAGRPVTLR